MVQNLGGFYAAEDHVEAAFTFEDDIICKGIWDFSGSREEDSDRIEIVGEKGAITFSTYGFTPIKLSNSRGTTSFDFTKPDHVESFLIDQVVEELLGKGKSPSTGVTAARTSWVMDEVVREYYQEK